MYSSDGTTLILDKVIYIMMRHRIVRPDYNFSESDIQDLNSHVSEYFHRLQTSKEILLQTLGGKLKNMETELLVGIFNDANKLKMFC